MTRDSIYIETSIVSYLAARRSRNLVVAAWQEITLEFWEVHQALYDLYTSELVVEEASMGDQEAVQRRLDILRGIPELPIDEEARTIAAALLAEGAIPPKAEFDALHVAIAAAHEMTFLLTWNCRHLDNPTLKPLIREVCMNLGHRCPEICTPLEITEGLRNEG